MGECVRASGFEFEEWRASHSATRGGMEKENVIPFNLNIPVYVSCSHTLYRPTYPFTSSTPSPRKHSVDSPSKKRLTGRKSKSGDSPTKSMFLTPPLTLPLTPLLTPPLTHLSLISSLVHHHSSFDYASTSEDSHMTGPSRAPIASKISFFERQDGSNTPLPDSLSWHFPEVRDKIELYERMFMGTPMKGQGRRDVVIKHDEWKKMMGELLGQVQEKTEQLKACEDSAAASEGRASSLSEELHSKYPSLLSLSPFSLHPSLLMFYFDTWPQHKRTTR